MIVRLKRMRGVSFIDGQVGVHNNFSEGLWPLYTYLLSIAVLYTKGSVSAECNIRNLLSLST